MARAIKRTWFISIDFRFKKDANYDKRLKAVKDYYKEIGFVEGDTTSSLIIYTKDKLMERQAMRELIKILRKKPTSNKLDVVVLRSVVRTASSENGKTRNAMSHTINILDKKELLWKQITEFGLYKKLKLESEKEAKNSSTN